MREVAEEIDAVAAREDVQAILASGYALTGWLSFYHHSPLPVFELGERYRWAFDPAPFPDLSSGEVLYVAPADESVESLAQSFSQVTELARVTRHRGDLEIETYVIYLLGDGVATPDRP
jgi:hypothetical protein